MSADTWRTCPKCVDEIMRDHERQVAAVRDLYGKIPADDYVRKIRDAECAPSIEETFREDYEIGLWDTELHVHYRGACTECDFSVEFEHVERKYQPAPTGDNGDG